MLEVIIIKPGMEDLNDGDKITFGAGLTALCGDLVRLNSDGSYNLIHSSLKDYRDMQKSVAERIFELHYELAVATPPNHRSSNTTYL